MDSKKVRMLTTVTSWHHKDVWSVIVVQSIKGSAVEDLHDPHSHSCSFHPVPEGTNVLLLLAYHECFQAEDNLINIKAKDTLVNELSQSMSTKLRCATYLIFKGHAGVNSPLTVGCI